uniref:Small VCP/p97-interacting protein n=1 Tax=Polytomella parva TaxID=51329 RepID=A0A7S0URJ2_9CHLO
MGACLSCCGDQEKEQYPSSSSYPREIVSNNISSNNTLSSKDTEARALAAEKAAERQKQFEKSAAGRAAYKTEKEIKESKKNPTGKSDNNDNSKDWLS